MKPGRPAPPAHPVTSLHRRLHTGDPATQHTRRPGADLHLSRRCLASVFPSTASKAGTALMAKRRQFWAQRRKRQPHRSTSASRVLLPRRLSRPHHRPARARPALPQLPRADANQVRVACVVLSGYRHELYNARIGGARHTSTSTNKASSSGRGSPVRERLAGTVGSRSQTATGDKNRGKGGVGRYDRSGFCHVDNRLYKADWTG